LYSSADFDAREPFTTPEIQRTNLASAVLRLKALDLGSLEDFPLIDAPRPELVREGIRTLFEIGAIDHRQSLTPIGKRLGRLPVDPRVGRMLIAAQEQGVLSEMLPIAAALEVQDPRDRPPEQRAEADAAHAKFMDPRSDFLAFLRIWRYYEQAKANFSRSRLTRELKANFLSPLRMFEWFDVYRQLKEMMLAENERDHSVLRMRAIRYGNDPDKVVSDDVALDLHRSLLTGLLSGVAMRDDKSQYTGCGGLKLFLWPGSGTMVTKPKWIVAAELVETSRQYARTVAQIQPQWLEKIADHLIKRSYSDSHWSSKLAGAFCYEQQTLFGLPIVTRLRVPLARIDPGGARDLLIDHGLVEEDLLTHAKAILFNRQLCAWIAQLAAKTRQRDWVVDPYRLRQLYQERLPEDIVDRARLEKYDRQLVVPDWTKRVRSDVDVATFLADGPPRSEPSLYFRPDDIVDVQEDQLQENDFPDELGVGASRLPLTYRFEPGTETDGIEIKVHASALSQISDEALGWLVPGMLHEKVVCMIKALPKRIRRNLVPTADVAKQVVAELTPLARQKPFLPSLCTVLTKHAEQSVAPEAFQQAKLPLHLRFLITIVDDDGNTIAQSRDVTPLQKQLGQTNSPVDESVPEDDAVWWRERMTSFEIERLPAEVVRRRGGVQVAQFPGLVDAGDAVTMKLFADAPSAEYHTRSAIVRLYALREKRELKSQVRWLPSLTESRVRLSTIMPTANIEQSLADLIARLAFVEQRPLVRTQEEFESRLRATGPAIGEATSRVAPWLSAFATAVFDTQQALESMPRSRHESTLADVRDQVAQLVFPEFWSRVPWEWLSQYPRYFRGIHYRLDKIRTGAAVRDGEALKTVVGLRQRWLNRLAEEIRGPELTCDQEFRWWLEELRVSLFAQPLGTIVKISPQRCEKWLQS
jgi:ATP-dependent helicase HrpA